MNNLKRIYIIGTSGSGKSFLSKKLSETLKIPSYDLDDIYWQKKYTVKRNVSKRKKLLKKVALRNKWIIEGVYGSWIESALKKSDLVILLDIHITILSWRILLRYFKRKGAEKETILDAINLIKYAHSYKYGDHSSSHGNHLILLKKHKLKYVILKSAKEINHFLDSI